MVASDLGGGVTPDAYAALLRKLGFESTRHVADFFGVAHSSAQKWAKDGPTPPVVRCLEVMELAGYSAADVERERGERDPGR